MPRFRRSTLHGLASGFLATISAVLEAKGLLLRRRTVVAATIARAPSSTNNQTGTRDPETHQTRKGNQWLFGMMAHIGTDVASGLVNTVVGTPANTHDLTVAGNLPHGGDGHPHGCGLRRRAMNG